MRLQPLLLLLLFLLEPGREAPPAAKTGERRRCGCVTSGTRSSTGAQRILLKSRSDAGFFRRPFLFYDCCSCCCCCVVAAGQRIYMFTGRRAWLAPPPLRPQVKGAAPSACPTWLLACCCCCRQLLPRDYGAPGQPRTLSLYASGSSPCCCPSYPLRPPHHPDWSQR